MSFYLELYAEVADWAEAERAVTATSGHAYLNVRSGRRRRWRRSRKPGIFFDYTQGQDVLSDAEDLESDTLTFSDEGRESLSRTIRALAGVLAPGWGIRAYWIGDTLVGERTLSAMELADLVQQSALSRGILYRVG